MPHHVAPLTALLLPIALAAGSGILGFGRRKPAPEPEPDDTEAEAADAPVLEHDPTADDESLDDTGETLPVLGLFPAAGEAAYPEAVTTVCHDIWQQVGVETREPDQQDAQMATRLFALTAVDSADAGRDAVALAALGLAAAANERGYTVLLIDADLDRPTLHRMPLFAPRDGVNNPFLAGVAEFLRGEASKVDPLVRIAQGPEGLLLLPAGNAASGDGVLTGTATLDRLLRLVGPLAEVVVLLAPPLFAQTDTTNVADLLPKANGVLVAYPSAFTAYSDTEAEEKLMAMDAEALGGIVVPPTAFAEETLPPAPVPPLPLLEESDDFDPEGTVKLPLPFQRQAQEAPPVSEPEPEPEEIAAPEAAVEAEPLPTTPVPVELPVPVPPAAPARPSFLQTTTPPVVDRPRGDARRSVPVESVSADTVAPIRQRIRNERNETPTTMTMTSTPTPPTYRPDVTVELLPPSDKEKGAALTLQASVGSATGPALLLEVRTLAAEAKRLRAENPGTDSTPDAPLLVLDALTAADAPEDATTLRLIVRESSAPDAVILLEATLDTPDALRIKSGTPKTSGVPPVRFELMSEPDGTARFRATVPPLGAAPALYVDLERATTEAGRHSRVVLRLAPA